MKKTIVFLLSLAFLINGMAQVSPSKPSEFGHCFMPYKDLRVLVVFVNIDNFDTIDDNNWSKGQPIPSWALNNNYLFNDFSEFDNLTPTSQNPSFSNYYYQLSQGRFRMIGEYLPITIHLPPLLQNQQYFKFDSLKTLVFQELGKEKYRPILARCDMRGNAPWNKGIQSNIPDSTIDFVVLNYRIFDDENHIISKVFNLERMGEQFQTVKYQTHCLMDIE